MPAQPPALEKFRAAYAAMLAAARELGAQLDPISEPVPKDIGRIIEIVAAYYQLPVSRILSHARDRSTATARHVAMALSRTTTRHSLEVIGAAFQRDHGCVMLAEKNVVVWAEQFTAFKLDYEALQKKVLAAAASAPCAASAFKPKAL